MQTPIFCLAYHCPEGDLNGPSRLTPSDEERIFLVHSRGLYLCGPLTMRGGLGGLEPSNPSSSLGGLPLSPHDFHDFRSHGPRMSVDDLDTPLGEFGACTPFHVTSLGYTPSPSASTWADNHFVASVFAVSVEPSPTPARDGGLSQTTGCAKTDSLVGTDLPGRTANLGWQTPSSMSHSVSRVTRASRSVAPAILPWLSSPSQTALPSPPPSDLFSTWTRRRRVVTAGIPQADVGYGFNPQGILPPTTRLVAVRESRPPRIVSPSGVSSESSIRPLPTVPIQRATNVTTRATPLLGVLPPDKTSSVRTPAVASEILISTEIEFFDSVKRYTQSDGRVNNAPNRCVTPPSGISYLAVLRYCRTTSSYTPRLTNGNRCQKYAP